MLWVDHMGVVASDLNETVEFYTKLFGEPIDKVSWRGDDASNVARMMGRNEDLELDAVFFQIPFTNTIFEVLAFHNTEQQAVVARNVDIGATHFAFYVEDIELAISDLGLEVSGPPMDLPIGPYRGGRSVYLTDPNGANIQLMQLAGRPGEMPVLRSGAPPSPSE